MSDALAHICDYCGLPLPRPIWGTNAGLEEPDYCCYGCRFAAAVTHARGAQGAATGLLARLGLAIFLTMNVMVFSMALWTEDLYGADAVGQVANLPEPDWQVSNLPEPDWQVSNLPHEGSWVASLRGVFQYASLLFALPVLFILGGPLLDSGWQSLRRGLWTADWLLLAGVGASFAYSTSSVLRATGSIYFEVGCMVLVLVTLGRWLEAHGKLRTTAAIEALEQLLPEQARIVRGGEETLIPLAEVKVGEHLLILPGERIPCDAVIVRDRAAVDEQVLTGESQPVDKKVGDRVWGGTLALDGAILIEVTARARGGALARLIEQVRDATVAKCHFERLADRVAGWFMPAVILIAVTAFAWHAMHYGLDRGILVGLAVILIACPCALGLATPMAVWAALGESAKAQVLFGSGEALERLAAVRAMRLDKTGTLTTGNPVVSVCTIGPHEDRNTVLAVASALANVSTHSYAKAIGKFASADPTPLLVVSDIRSHPGRGIQARESSDGKPLYLGSPRWFRELGLVFPSELDYAIAQGQTTGQALCCVGWECAARAVFELREQLRPEAAEAIAELRAAGLDIAVLTGDHSERGRALGKELGVGVEAELLPEDKVAAIQGARQAFGAVAMVGDGINDAPALACSDVGIAMGCGADVTRESAAVCLLGNNLLRLPWAVAHARRTVSVIRGNLFWAFAYNVVGIGIACTGRLNPVLASLAMVLSSFFVVTNSLRLARSPQASPAPSKWRLARVPAEEAA